MKEVQEGLISHYSQRQTKAGPRHSQGPGQTERLYPDFAARGRTTGITWEQIRQGLIATFGSAPVKRASLYSILSGVQWYKTMEGKGIVVYPPWQAT